MRRRFGWVFSMAAMLAAGFLIWSRKPAGTTMSNPQEKREIRSFSAFITTTPSATESQRMLFFAANRLYRRGDTEGAVRVYEHLVSELPGNSVVRDNLDLSKQGRG